MIERSLDLLKVERRVSTLTDLMSDVGGVFGLLVMFGRVFSRLWNFNSFNNFLVSRLYKIMKPKEKLKENTSYFNRSEFFTKSNLPQCLTFLCRYRTRKEIAMRKAREKLNEELNIVQNIKSWRYMERALQKLLTRNKRLKMKEKARYVVVDPE